MLLRVLLVVVRRPRRRRRGRAGWPPVLAVLAVLTMTVANLIAGRQESVKRMLAYSSIAHAGYVARRRRRADARPGSRRGASVLFYLLTYTVSTAGAFGALILCGSRGARGGELRGPRRPRQAAPGGGARVLALPPVARRHPADGRLLRQVVHLPRGDRRRASTGSPIIALREQRDRRVLLPARPRLHVHARAGGRARPSPSRCARAT